VVKNPITESEWQVADDPAWMLNYFRGIIRQHARKLRLFAVACCRCIWPLLVDPRSRRAVEVAERYADGAATEEELRAAANTAEDAHREIFDVVGKVGSTLEWAAVYTCVELPFHSARSVSDMAATPRCLEVRTPRPNLPDQIQLFPCTITPRDWPRSLVQGKWQLTRLKEGVATGVENDIQADLLRCIFGTPFRPVAFDARWRTPAAVALARSMYEDRSFTGLPFLADALGDAGCADEGIHAHCRQSGPHVRGCWVVALVLGKT
jgi:hypothetical protein